jgi:hypothetical protein
MGNPHRKPITRQYRQESDSLNSGLSTGEKRWAKLSERFMRISIPDRIIKGRSVGIIFWNHRFSPVRERISALSLSRSMAVVRKANRQRNDTFFKYAARSCRFVAKRGCCLKKNILKSSFQCLQSRLVRMQGIMYTLRSCPAVRGFASA